MNIMDKFQAGIEKILVPIASKLNAQRHICAIRDAFILTFPLTMAGSLMILLNFVLLSPDGFVAKIFKLGEIFPNLSDYQAIFSPVLKGSTDILAILVVFLIARNLAKQLKADDLLSGLTAVSVYFIIYPNYVSVEGTNHLVTKYMGAQGLFVAIIVGLVVGELMSILSKSDKLEIKMPEQVPPAVARTFKVLLPIIIITISFSILNFIIQKVAPGGLHELVYNVVQKPLTSLGKNVGSVIGFALVSQLLWIMGIHGPNTIAAVRDTMFAEAGNANLAYVASNGSAWGAPFPVTWGGLNDAFANYGGSGCTLGLIIAIFIFSKAQDQRSIAKLSFAPGLFNINESIIFGLPIVLNPIYIIPFIITPIVNILIGYTAIVILEIIPPIAYGVPWTTPGPLIPFLGSGGNFMALLVGIVCLVVSVCIYAPFVIASSKATQKEMELKREKEQIS
ncbi:PTS sugar transporter subunit IIC [Clostridium gasigenes]|uniref:PTS sugar transporter subunit IIC n=1 Tax=Clostridium gasigenes TaxID=94869 RepID=UPI001438315D|nr:PTS sugar transporter subunit IIC [Clostridium gasigenes]MBU3104635.1 PTS sugar transporter subunit IIC [Clostridium gasigenes]MBU3133767.1 PTS sugar transporter subunit IIC [Clostridium gasigenes]MBU3136856.1 PTS sugar transporter subunit IIC [Clostridium gasigenes]NKF06514.1 PTS sugar transporter subunit IIC [Clostridium gasigenes]QSW21127.1 PTS sugar transporter subunit IIC [Clostridium gasigenes]